MTHNSEYSALAWNINTTPYRTLTVNPQIRGRVTDNETGSFLPGATVEVKLGGDHHLTKTNFLGFYEFVDLPAGDYKIKITADGYYSENARIDVIENGTLDRNFTLVEKRKGKGHKE